MCTIIFYIFEKFVIKIKFKNNFQKFIKCKYIRLLNIGIFNIKIFMNIINKY